MRFALPPAYHQHRHEAVAVAIAAIGVGMFIGTSIIGPLVSRGSTDKPVELNERTTFEAMMARPDPFPFRAPTPAFDMSGAPNYAAAAKEKAQAELGGQPSDNDAFQASDQPRRSHGSRWRYRVPDRFAPQ
jgi:hypothetical protein